jgi:hypothetical protein
MWSGFPLSQSGAERKICGCNRRSATLQGKTQGEIILENADWDNSIGVVTGERIVRPRKYGSIPGMG